MLSMNDFSVVTDANTFFEIRTKNDQQLLPLIMSYSFKGNGIYTQVFPIRFLRLYARWMISWNLMFSFLGHTLFLFSLHFKSCILI